MGLDPGLRLVSIVEDISVFLMSWQSKIKHAAVEG